MTSFWWILGGVLAGGIVSLLRIGLVRGPQPTTIERLKQVLGETNKNDEEFLARRLDAVHSDDRNYRETRNEVRSND